MATVIGNDGANWLGGSGGADHIKGFGGDDTLKGGGGADRLDGGSGLDTAIYADSSEGVIVDLRTGTGRHGTAEGDTLVRIENVYGSSYDDELYGDAGANSLSGLDGFDTLSGGGGADVLAGGYGTDLLSGGAGGDTLDGGEDLDRVSYEDSPAGVVVSLIGDTAWGGDADGDDLNGIEAVRGSAFADSLRGDNGFNELSGMDGDDFLYGYGGTDGLLGGSGQDALYGMEGDDYLLGNQGDDRLEGGTGVDIMKGGGGTDTLFWSSIDDTGKTPEAADSVLEFNPAEGDRLDLSGIDADVYAAGNQAFKFIGAAAFSGTPGEINYVHVNGETIIQMQTGTSADVEGLIRLDGIVTPEASWFAL